MRSCLQTVKNKRDFCVSCLPQKEEVYSFLMDIQNTLSHTKAFTVLIVCKLDRFALGINMIWALPCSFTQDVIDENHTISAHL